MSSRSVKVGDVDVEPCHEKEKCDFGGHGRRVHYHCFCGATVQRFERMVRHSHKHLSQSVHVQQDASSRCSQTHSDTDKTVGSHATQQSTTSCFSTACTECGKVVLKKNLRRHVQRQHRSEVSSNMLSCVLVDKMHGIFMCAKNMQGSLYPVHVQLKLTAGVQEVFCEDSECQEAVRVAGRCNFAVFQCPHLKSAAFASVLPDSPHLLDAILCGLVDQKLIKQSSIAAILDLYKKAVDDGCTLWLIGSLRTLGSSATCLYIPQTSVITVA
jgi:hypothetical protein